MKTFRTLAVFASAAVFSFARHTLTSDQEKTVDDWISNNPEFRQATDEDCMCAKSLMDARTGAGPGDLPVPDYSPYKVAADFNKDGVEDFAVVVLRKTNPTTGFAFLIFNGSPDGRFLLAFESRRQNLREQGIFFGRPERNDGLLRIGRFYWPKSWLVPKGSTYEYPRVTL